MCIPVIIQIRQIMDNPPGETAEKRRLWLRVERAKRRKKNTRFSDRHDVLLLREVIARNLYTAAAGEVTTTWAAIAAPLNAAEAAFNIGGRRCHDQTTLLLDYFRTDDTASLRRFVLQNQIHFSNLQLFKLVDFEPSISLTLCPSLLHKGHFFACSEGLPYILAYKPTIFGWILRTKLWGSAYTRVVPHSHTLNSQSQSGIDH